jgi:hypothetical protein
MGIESTIQRVSTLKGVTKSQATALRMCLDMFAHTNMPEDLPDPEVALVGDDRRLAVVWTLGGLTATFLATRRGRESYRTVGWNGDVYDLYTRGYLRTRLSELYCYAAGLQGQAGKVLRGVDCHAVSAFVRGAIEGEHPKALEAFFEALGEDDLHLEDSTLAVALVTDNEAVIRAVAHAVARGRTLDDFNGALPGSSSAWLGYLETSDVWEHREAIRFYVQECGGRVADHWFEVAQRGNDLKSIQALHYATGKVPKNLLEQALLDNHLGIANYLIVEAQVNPGSVLRDMRQRVQAIEDALLDRDSGPRRTLWEHL